MIRLIQYGLMLMLLVVACEDIYDADIEQRENVIVADARILAGESLNSIRLSKTLNFNSKFTGNYPPVENATVTIADDTGAGNLLREVEPGQYIVDFELNPENKYQLIIEYEGERFESAFESVPPAPSLDTVYGVAETKIIEQAGANSVSDFREKEGAQLYVDINNRENLKYYRFTSRKVMQYTYVILVPFMGALLPVVVYAWKSYYPREFFNIAGPGEYSTGTDIAKHPLCFMEKYGPVTQEESFDGWILILQQYSLSESAYNYYSDLNDQLKAEGRLFDPLYVQARGNLKCTSNPGKLILGSFEITRSNETRYYVRRTTDIQKYLVKPIPYFYYIPESGKSEGQQPAFWESIVKDYP